MINKEDLKNSKIFENITRLTKEEITAALDSALKKIDQNMELLGEQYPQPATSNNKYDMMENTEWTNGFWTGILWLAYEYTNDEKYRKLAEKHVQSFLHRIENKIEVDHHDLGFLYIPSCVSAYKLTGNLDAKRAALLAADQLVSRYQETGEFIQAWGELGAADNYRLIVDCLLNIPLLYWAYEETKNEKYFEIASKHYKTTLKNAVREDASAYHTFYFDPKDGKPLKGVTRQGYRDDSSWARGQAWIMYGIALNYNYVFDESAIYNFEAVSNYFLNRLPEDLVCYWDLIFSDKDGQPRDSSAAAVAVCGIQEMNRYLPETNESKHLYNLASHGILRSLINHYTDVEVEGINPLLTHGVYSWHSGKGVDEGNLWGDYFYMEALVRFLKDWKMYW